MPVCLGHGQIESVHDQVCSSMLINCELCKLLTLLLTVYCSVFIHRSKTKNSHSYTHSLEKDDKISRGLSNYTYSGGHMI